jgi:N-acetyl-gamma-glutamyl-phosphate reductase
MVSNPDTVVIDTSTAHRVSPAWTYGFPEVNGLRQQIQSSCRIANPGCHATGFISLVAPLIGEGAISPDARLSCFSLTGYSGGGKKMIAEYEASGRDPLLDAPRQYALGQRHKHLPEMRIVSGLRFEPVFSPVVAPFYAGMEVTVPLFADQLRIPVSSLPDLYRAYYNGSKMIQLTEAGTENGFCSAAGLSGRDGLEITVTGNEERILLISRFDNLGKGASGAAIQNMNLRFGLPEETGLCLS